MDNLEDNRVENIALKDKLYSPDLADYEKRMAIMLTLENNLPFKVQQLPFLDSRFNGKCSSEKLEEILEYLQLDIKDNYIEYQKKYYLILDKIIDGIVNIRYLNNKKGLEYPDIITLHNKIIEVFKRVVSSRDYSYMDYLANDLAIFTFNNISKEEIIIELYNYYDLFVKKSNLDISDTSDFCNKILNANRNMFISKEKDNILNNIIYKIRLSKRKITSINNGIKIDKVSQLLKNNNLDALGISKEEFNNIINNTKYSILNNKDINKLGIVIDSLALDKLFNLFIFLGDIDKNMIKIILNIDNLEVIDYIYNKITRIKYFLSKKIKIDDFSQLDLDDDTLPKLDFSNYLILDRDKYLYNVADILLNLDDDIIDKILENKEYLKDIMYLIPLLNLLDEFDTKTFINIMCYYERIQYKIYITNKYDSKLDFSDLVLKRIDDLITLGNAYASVDDITLAALTTEVINLVGEEHSNKYLEFYLKMINREKSNIPNVYLVTDENYNTIDDNEVSNDKYYFESGYYSDPQRLAIGKKPYKYSCADLLNLAGVKTYCEALLENTGNVILIKDKYKKLVSRIFIFRRGNLINMVTNAGQTYPLKLYRDIALQIMKQAIENKDNLEYIFVNSRSIDDKDHFDVVQDQRFKDRFAHSDLFDTASLLVSRNMMQGIVDKELNLDFDIKPKAIYIKDRKPINYSSSEEEITRIKALRICMETELIRQEDMKRSFEPFYSKEYDKVVAGEDWYIAIRKDGFIEEVILPSNDPRTYEEFNYVKDMLLDNNRKL